MAYLHLWVFPFRTHPGSINTLLVAGRSYSTDQDFKKSSKDSIDLEHQTTIYINHERPNETAFRSIWSTNFPKPMWRVGSLTKGTSRWAGKRAELLRIYKLNFPITATHSTIACCLTYSVQFSNKVWILSELYGVYLLVHFVTINMAFVGVYLLQKWSIGCQF